MSRTVKKVMCKSCNHVFKHDFKDSRPGTVRKCICPKCKAVFEIETPHIKIPKAGVPWKASELAILVPSISVIVTLLLWLIPWVNYTPGVTGRGFPLVWYTKWVLTEGASPQLNIGNFFLDILIVAVFVCIFLFESSVFKKARIRRAKKKVGILK